MEDAISAGGDREAHQGRNPKRCSQHCRDRVCDGDVLTTPPTRRIYHSFIAPAPTSPSSAANSNSMLYEVEQVVNIIDLAAEYRHDTALVFAGTCHRHVRLHFEQLPRVGQIGQIALAV